MTLSLNRPRSALVFLLTLIPAFHPSLSTGQGKDAAKEPPVTREAVCRWAAEPPKLDGKLDDPVWETASVIDNFPAFWAGTSPPASSATRARLLWNGDSLYFSATLTDSELKAFGDKHNDHLWNGDVFELFFKPSTQAPAYYEFQTNPNQAVFEVAFPRRGGISGEFGKLPVLGMTTVVRLDGTLDKPGDLDRGWSVEGRIPWSIFQPTGGKPKPGDVWSFALCRYDYGPEGTQPILMSSAPLTQPNFHRFEDYGKLTFEGPRR